MFLSILLLSPAALVLALYGHEPIIYFLDSNGYFHFEEPALGIAVRVRGTPGANCTLLTEIYNGNPEPTAAIPDGISLTHFAVVIINMNANQFSNVSITINYTTTDFQDIQPPYAVYEYVPGTDSFVKLPSAVDVAAKTITFTETSIVSGLFAIGGVPAAPRTEGEGAITLLLILIGAIIAIVVVAVLIVMRFKRVLLL